MNKFFTLISGKAEDFSLENRILNVVGSISLVCTAIASFTNIFMHTIGMRENSIIILAFLCSVFITYFSRIKKTFV